MDTLPYAHDSMTKKVKFQEVFVFLSMLYFLMDNLHPEFPHLEDFV